MGNVARPGFAGFGLCPGRVKPGQAGSGVRPGWVLPGWLTQANTYTFAFSQALLRDPILDNLLAQICNYAIQIALTGRDRAMCSRVLPGPGFAGSRRISLPLVFCRVLYVWFAGGSAPVRVCGVAGQVALRLGKSIV